ncbi:delta-60 repeat domain-containing protein/Por secretion system C-terminal sorting domain-containing protein [Cnuella takakiae]|uniref:Delta-60 repeat domain-containing protein/Por secretion system C-terminal sorting domain-containing protein n=1 Tax=Cnuella takakiae TaxID=1302690 RepID=A0A1M4WZG8_9BACT|nr:T9SS type A sorting domain-containing protein [Cnuella takakiae]OLY91576.1 hypothetical protein BUE76_06410 [Cnuella takakiae]SHE86661.1 delta-60 repeat domain-containing protein/Por secretion system C-terminal sorting domain-containing protein [Cnuella takakiae]
MYKTVLFLFAILVQLHATSQPIQPNTSFGTNGFVYSATHPRFNTIAVDKDGNIITGHYTEEGIVISRYLTDGKPDQSFGSSGSQLIPGATSTILSREDLVLYLLEDGKILVAGLQSGESTDALILMRLQANGALDASFGNGGTGKYVHPKYLFNPQSIVIEQSGKIIVGGYTTNINDEIGRLSLIRFNANGTLDLSFGEKGEAYVQGATNDNRCYQVVLQPDGKILMVGEAISFRDWPGIRRILHLVRYDPAGKMDSSFSDDGIATLEAMPETAGYALQLQADGKIVVAGTAGGGAIDEPRLDPAFLLARFLPDGKLDNSFGNKGFTITRFDNNWALVSNVFQTKDRFIITGKIGNFQTQGPSMALAAYTLNGLPDAGFGPEGKAFIPFSHPGFVADATLFQNNLYVTGSLQKPPGLTAFIAAFKLDAAPTVGSFTLVDATSDMPIKTITNGMTINLADYKGRAINIRANTTPAKVGSVMMKLTGKQVHTQIEQLTPYALFGGDGNNYNPWQPAVGSYSLSATPYSEKGGMGVAGEQLDISFNIINDLSLSGFTLVHSGADYDLRQLKNGDVINLATTPDFTIRIDSGKGLTGSVVIGLNNNTRYRTENKPPYALSTNTASNYYRWYVLPGTYTINATPFSDRNGRGTAGNRRSITITIINSTDVLTAATPSNKLGVTSLQEKEKITVQVHPNPAFQDAILSYQLPRTQYVNIVITDALGKKVMDVFSGITDSGMVHRKTLQSSRLTTGIYFVRISTADGQVHTHKIWKQ